MVDPGAPGVDHLAHLRREGERLVGAVRRADLDAPVPGLAWDVRTVAVHTGAVHRWAADLVRRRLPTKLTGGSRAFAPAALDDTELTGWLAAGLEDLVTVLDDAPADLDCFTFVAGVAPRTFWRRRQAHETAVHRGDVESAGGDASPATTGTPVTPVAADFAQDGLAELVGAFAREPGFASGRSGSLLLDPDDGPAWRVRFGHGRPNEVATGDGLRTVGADAVVRGSSAALYRWAWNRPSPVAVEARGEKGEAALEAWRAVRVV